MWAKTVQKNYLLQEVADLVRVLCFVDMPQSTRLSLLDQNSILRLLTATSHVHCLQCTCFTQNIHSVFFLLLH